MRSLFVFLVITFCVCFASQKVMACDIESFPSSASAPESEAEMELGLETETESVSESETEMELGSETETEMELGSETETESVSESETEMELGSETETEMELGSETETESVSESETETEPVPAPVILYTPTDDGGAMPLDIWSGDLATLNNNTTQILSVNRNIYNQLVDWRDEAKNINQHVQFIFFCLCFMIVIFLVQHFFFK